MVKAGEMDAVTSQEYVQTIHVSPGDISKYGFAAAFKRTLRNAKESGKLLNEKGIVKVEVPAGTYEIDSSMQMIQSLGNGMRLENVRKTIVTDNSMKFVGKKSSKEFHGIQLRLESQCTDIKNNKITGYNANGIYLNTKSYAQTISGNKISKVNKYGIGIENAKAGKIVRNTISSSKRYGINVIEHAVVSSISGNKIGKCGEKIHVSKNSKAKSVKN